MTAGTDPHEQRDRILEGYRWILVDEYQDIREHEYRLISALAGRTLLDPEAKITLMAVGDDDQNIYSFRGSTNSFIKSFEADYSARTAYLTENYRSTANIINASNHLIAAAPGRLKKDHPITIDTARRSHPKGGPWAATDPVTAAQVQILPAGNNIAEQAVLALQEVQRMAALDPHWDWNKVAVISRQWSTTDPIRVAADHAGIPTQQAREDFTATWHLRETRHLLDHAATTGITNSAILQAHLRQMRPNHWSTLLQAALSDYQLDTNGEDLPTAFFNDWLAEWIRTYHDTQSGLMLTTAHSAKGLEYDHVVILDGHWDARRYPLEAERRLFYVAMTRARKTLTICKMEGANNAFIPPLLSLPGTLQRSQPAHMPLLPPGIQNRFQRTSLRDANLGYAGRYAPDHKIHKDIAALQPGDYLNVKITSTGRYLLLSAANRTVGMMSQTYKPLPGPTPQARVLAIARWYKYKSEPPYADQLKSDSWEVVIPEFIFPPA